VVTTRQRSKLRVSAQFQRERLGKHPGSSRQVIVEFDAYPIIRSRDTSYLVIWATRREALALIFTYAISVSPNYI